MDVKEEGDHGQALNRKSMNGKLCKRLNQSVTAEKVICLVAQSTFSFSYIDTSAENTTEIIAIHNLPPPRMQSNHQGQSDTMTN